MSNILLDTHIFRKLKGELTNLLCCISLTRDTIILTPEIEDEYRQLTRTPTHLGYRQYRNDISRKCKLRDRKSGRIKSIFKRYKRKIKLPKDPSDHKWIKTAISEQARYIISNDPDLSRPPFRTNENFCEVVYPTRYIQDNCP